jgi:hypothetical protein
MIVKLVILGRTVDLNEMSLISLSYFKNTHFKTLINLSIYNADKCYNVILLIFVKHFAIIYCFQILSYHIVL